MKLFLFSVALCGFGQQPRIQNAKLETRASSPSLDSALRTIVQAQSEPAWIGYSVPRSPRQDGWSRDSSLGLRVGGRPQRCGGPRHQYSRAPGRTREHARLIPGFRAEGAAHSNVGA